MNGILPAAGFGPRFGAAASRKSLYDVAPALTGVSGAGQKIPAAKQDVAGVQKIGQFLALMA